MKEFYTYLWLREDGSPYYAGKGHGYRAYTVHRNTNRKMKAPPKERIVVYPSTSESDAFETEIALIWYYGRKDLGMGCLRNLSDGGDGPAGRVCPEYERERISITLKSLGIVPPCQSGFKHTDETRKRIGITLKGRVISAVTREKLRVANSKPKRMSTCHPGREYDSKGLCKACAVKAKREQRRTQHEHSISYS
jgi:hypothetical protein